MKREWIKKKLSKQRKNVARMNNMNYGFRVWKLNKKKLINGNLLEMIGKEINHHAHAWMKPDFVF